MSKFVQNIISVRFVEVLDELIEKRIVDNVAKFCQKMDYPPQSMSQIRLGKRDVTIDLVSKLFNEFGGSPMYLFQGKGPKTLSPEIVSMVQEEQIPYGRGDEKKTVKTLESLVKSKDDIILLLKKDNQRLEAELKKVQQ